LKALEELESPDDIAKRRGKSLTVRRRATPIEPVRAPVEQPGGGRRRSPRGGNE